VGRGGGASRLREFGYSVSVSGEVAIVGAYRNDDNGRDSGSTYIYRHSRDLAWMETKVRAADGAAGDEFGFLDTNGDGQVDVKDLVQVITGCGRCPGSRTLGSRP
jgi:hypothetical protein